MKFCVSKISPSGKAYETGVTGNLDSSSLDLLYEDVHLPKVAEGFPELSSLINFIVDHNSLDDDEVPYPTIKEVPQATKMGYDRTRKLIKKLYEIVFPFMDHKYLKFTKVKYELYCSYFGNMHYMLIDRSIGKVDAILVRPDGFYEGAAEPRGDDWAIGF